MSFVASCTVLERGVQSSKKSSGKDIDPRAPMRLLFPGGWNNKDSDVFRWYDDQPHKFFRRIQYYKEQQGVGHEFVVLPLLDADKAPTDWFCRIERMADPAQQLAAVGANGTEAFDYIHASNRDPLQPCLSADLQPCPVKDQRAHPGPEKIAEINLPRSFDLLDVLVVCHAIHEHPQARRYTLQQYNCYFFCWAILLLLSRRSVEWEKITLRQRNDIRASVLKSIAAPVPAKNAKLAHTLSFVYKSDTDPTQSLLYKALVAELSSDMFSHSVHLALSSVLWAHSGHAVLKNSLEGRSQALAKQTLELLIGDLDVNADAKIKCSLRSEADLGPGVDVQGLYSEGAVIFREAYVKSMAKSLEEKVQSWRRSYMNDHIQQGSIKRRILQPATMCLATIVAYTCFSLPGGVWGAYLTAKLLNDVAVHHKQNKGIRALKYVGNTLRYLPNSLRSASKVMSLAASILSISMELEEGFDLLADDDIHCSLRALNMTAAQLHQRLPKQDGRPNLSLIFLLIVLGSQKWIVFPDMSPNELWRRVLWDFLGDITANAILKVVLVERATELKFSYLQAAKHKETLMEEPGPQLTPTVQLQHFIEERIVRLSKYDIDHAPIIKHVLVPAMAPPLKSQEQMKDALEHIWRTANKERKFRE